MADEKQVKLTIIADTYVNGEFAKTGEEITCSESEGKALISAEKAVPAPTVSAAAQNTKTAGASQTR